MEEGFKLAEESLCDPVKIEQMLMEKRFKEQISYAWHWCQKYGIKAIDVEVDKEQKKGSLEAV